MTRQGDARGVAYTQVEIADLLLDELELLPREELHAEALTFVELLLDEAVQQGYRDLEPRFRWQAAALLTRTSTARSAGEMHLERCLEATREQRAISERAECSSRLAILVARRNAERARDLMNEAMAIAAKEENPRRVADISRAQSALAWMLEPVGSAIVVSRAGLDAIENIRALQPPGPARVTVPSRSFTVDVELRSRRLPARKRPTVLALVDPDVGVESIPARTRASFDRFPTELGPLPFARKEGSIAVERVGGDGTLRLGPDANEANLKRDVNDGYRVVHLAAHSVVDDVSPHRSAVVLGPGSDQEDGLLQAREVVDLQLDGSVVFLASCQSAGGALVGGEGVLSLSRAFLSTGASAVLGSRSPLRDDDAYKFFDALYKELARGSSVVRAMQDAQRRAVEDGRPPGAWAGIVLLGDGATVPFKDGSPRHRAMRIVRFVLGGFGLVLLAALVTWRFRSKHRA